MSYEKAEGVLPLEVIELIQQYVDGKCIYIPRKENSRKIWGEGTTIRGELHRRNIEIFNGFLLGHSTTELAEKFYLSKKSIQRIIHKMKHSK